MASESGASNLGMRVLSALVMAPLVVGCLVAGGLWFVFLLALGTVLLLVEWEALTRVEDERADRWFLLVPGLLALLLAAVGQPVLASGVVIVAMLIRCLSHWMQPKLSLWAALGLGYVLIASISLLRVMALGGMPWVLWLFLTVWATDIGGYVFGKTIGGTKLAPSISPGKTWSGLGGCVIFAGLVGVAMALWQGDFVLGWMLGSMGLALVAQAGDLFESKVKRLFGKKDSGALIPGHGGLLDRVDGLLFAAPVVALYLSWVRV